MRVDVAVMAMKNDKLAAVLYCKDAQYLSPTYTLSSWQELFTILSDPSLDNLDINFVKVTTQDRVMERFYNNVNAFLNEASLLDSLGTSPTVH